MLIRNYPDTAFGLDDPQDVRPTCYCVLCGVEIYGEPIQSGGFWADYPICRGCYDDIHREEDDP